jgi:2-dehydro-3-deoxygalactonokinase
MKSFISLDWGTTSFRAYQVDAEGKVVTETAAPEGILAVRDAAFEMVLESHIGPWSKALPIIASGMITSRQGWVECPYAQCPASVADLASAITTKATASGRKIHFITGLHHASASIRHDVLRGEETQVFGAVGEGADHFITPGTHSKWIDVTGGKITSFATYMTGETFALYRNHSILGRLMQEGPADDASFAKGVEAAFEAPADLLHNLFAVRTLGLFNDLPAEKLASYLSGLLIGAEVASAVMRRGRGGNYMVLGSAQLAATYLTALKIAGITAKVGDPLCAIKGQRLIAQAAGIL